jgi:hypothetical protein
MNPPIDGAALAGANNCQTRRGILRSVDETPRPCHGTGAKPARSATNGVNRLRRVSLVVAMSVDHDRRTLVSRELEPPPTAGLPHRHGPYR